VWFVTEIAPVIFITALPKRCKPGTTTFNNSIAFIINRTCLHDSKCINFLLFRFKTCEHSTGITLLLLLSHSVWSKSISRKQYDKMHVKGSIFSPEYAQFKQRATISKQQIIESHNDSSYRLI